MSGAWSQREVNQVLAQTGQWDYVDGEWVRRGPFPLAPKTQKKEDMTDYRIVVGRPPQVEKEVRELIETGWVLHGELMLYRPSGEQSEVLVQGMIKYVDSSNRA